MYTNQPLNPFSLYNANAVKKSIESWFNEELRKLLHKKDRLQYIKSTFQIKQLKLAQNIPRFEISIFIN